jgi:subtilisin family serine protease
MHRNLKAFALVAMLTPAWLTAGATTALGQTSTAPHVPQALRSATANGRRVRVIVRVRTGFTPEGAMRAREVALQRAAIRSRVADVIGRLPSTARARRFLTIPFFSAEIDSSTLDRLAADPDVTSIEEDVADAPALAQSVPLVGAPEAWSAGYSGLGWAIAVLDTGVDKTHPFLSGKVVSEACYSNAAADGISLCPGGASSSVASGSGVNCSSTYEGCEHGTHVAGIAAGHGTSFSGVARDGNVISIQVFTGYPAGGSFCAAVPCVVSYSSDQIRGLERVLALNGTFNIAAVNMSLGGSTKYSDQATCDADNSARKAAIDNLRSVGIATVISSGNSGFFDGLGEPGCISSAVSVGSTTKADVISTFSNTASFLSLLAPGESITSSLPGGSFGALSGTSMAAPHVAGAWAVIKSGRPEASVSQVLAALQSTGTLITEQRSGFAFARIQVDAALNTLVRTEMSLDGPSNGADVTVPFAVAGWALEPTAASGTGVDAIHVWAFPLSGGSATFLGAAPYGVARPDVGAAFGPQFTNSGFSLSASSLGPGGYTVVAYAHSARTGTFAASRAATVNVANASRPASSIDGPATNAVVAPSFDIAGWAVDLGPGDGTGVDVIHVYAYPADGSSPIFVGVASYGIQRTDVGAAYGTRFTDSGYTLSANLAAGGYTVVVFARSVISGLFSSIARSVTVRAPGDPAMAIDAPASNTAPAQPFQVAGWAIDRDAPTGPGVDAIHVWAFPTAPGAGPIFLGVANYGASRPDVGAVFGTRFTSSGYDLSVSNLPPGTYQIAVYAHSGVTDTFNQSHAVTITVF